MKEAIARNDKQTQRFHGFSCRYVAIAFRGKSLVIIAFIVGNRIYGNIFFLSVFIRFGPETTVVSIVFQFGGGIVARWVSQLKNITTQN
jgi:hypothetical protein